MSIYALEFSGLSYAPAFRHRGNSYKSCLRAVFTHISGREYRARALPKFSLYCDGVLLPDIEWKDTLAVKMWSLGACADACGVLLNYKTIRGAVRHCVKPDWKMWAIARIGYGSWDGSPASFLVNRGHRAVLTDDALLDELLLAAVSMARVDVLLEANKRIADIATRGQP